MRFEKAMVRLFFEIAAPSLISGPGNGFRASLLFKTRAGLSRVRLGVNILEMVWADQNVVSGVEVHHAQECSRRHDE
ncbi:MAG: hypothetical protein U0Q18_23675 [Bryobacteraceae bacterium]